MPECRAQGKYKVSPLLATEAVPGEARAAQEPSMTAERKEVNIFLGKQCNFSSWKTHSHDLTLDKHLNLGQV